MENNEDDARRLEAFLEALQPSAESLTNEEVDELVAETGCDLATLRRTLHDAAAELAREHRRKSGSAPKALVAFARAMDDGPTLSKDPQQALAQAARWIRGLARPLLPPDGPIRVAAAYRKGDDQLSPRDRDLLEAAAQRLRDEPGKKDG